MGATKCTLSPQTSAQLLCHAVDLPASHVAMSGPSEARPGHPFWLLIETRYQGKESLAPPSQLATSPAVSTSGGRWHLPALQPQTLTRGKQMVESHRYMMQLRTAVCGMVYGAASHMLG